MLQFDKAALADWQERHGEKVMQALNLGETLLSPFMVEHEKGIIDVVFEPSSYKGAKFMVEYRYPKIDDHGRSVSAAIFCREII